MGPQEVDLVPHPVVGLVFKVGDAEKFLHGLGFESLDPFFRVTKQGPCFTIIEEDGGEWRHSFAVTLIFYNEKTHKARLRGVYSRLPLL